MMGLEAVVGSWYQGGDGQIFEVVAVDEDAGTIEIQYLEGDIGEFELDVWRILTLVRVPPPDDWESVIIDQEPDGADLVGDEFWQVSTENFVFED